MLLGALFVVYAVQTGLRQCARFAVSDACVEVIHRGVRLPWDDLTQVELAYYSTRRDRENGWMELTLRCGKRALTIDSRLSGFERIARLAAGAARANRLRLSHATLSNFAALGVKVESDER